MGEGVNMAAKTEKTIAKKIQCMKCGTERAPSPSTYYANNNPLLSTDKLEICKNCILDFIGEKDSKGHLDNIYLVLALLDKPFVVDRWEACDREWSKYVTQLSSLPQYKGLMFRDSDFGIRKNITNNSYTGDVSPDNDEKFYNSKWMGDYTQSDVEYLENYYIGLDRDFKIVTINHKDYAKKIAKASLHMDKCFQDMLNGIAGADAKYKSARETFDTLSKSAQFSESQRGQNDVGLGGFGVVFDQVEQNKWIPKHIPMDEDAMDKIINQFATIRESV
jgi:hypothetical protein